MTSESNRFRSWFDNLENQLEQEAELAGLFEHPTLTGSAREFLVKRVLKSVLPPIIHTGSGRLIDNQGQCSKQVDIVLYDSRFPVFEIESGIGMYLIEGVIGTIEVKSILTKEHLLQTLDNVNSIINLSPGMAMHQGIKFMERVDELMGNLRIDRDEAERRLYYELIPSAYVFAFNSRMKAKTLAKVVSDWFDSQGQTAVSNGHCAVVPRVIVAGSSVGLLDDGFVLIEPEPDVMEKALRDYGSEVKHLMAFWSIKHRFGILVSHVLHTVCNRYGLLHGATGLQYGIDPYLPLVDYFKSTITKEGVSHIFWKTEKGDTKH